jgi:hypothetical protein
MWRYVLSRSVPRFGLQDRDRWREDLVGLFVTRFRDASDYVRKTVGVILLHFISKGEKP